MGRIVRVRLIRTWLLCTTLASASVFAAVEFEPSVSVGLIRTDNVDLAAENEQSETIFELRPSFSLTQDSLRLSSSVAYRLEAYYYDRRSDTSIFNSLDSNAAVALDVDNFFLDFGANRSQSIRDPEAAIPRRNLFISSNRVDRNEAFFGPRFDYSLGGDAAARGSYRRSWVRYDDPSPAELASGFRRDLNEDRFDFSIDNLARQRGLSWAVRLNRWKTEYDEVFVPWEFRRASAELGGWIGSELRVFVNGGKESAWDRPFDPSLEDNFWEVGFVKTAGTRLTLELAGGERSFGSSGRMSVRVTSPRGSMRVSYTETPTTQGRNPYDRGRLLIPDEPFDFLSRPGFTDRFISKRFQLNWNVDLPMTRLSWLVFDEARDERTTADGIPLGDANQSGARFSLDWRAGSRTTIVFNLSRSRREFSSGSRRDLRSAGVGADYRLGPRTQLALNIERTEDVPLESGVGGAGYDVNLLSIVLTRTFF